MYLLEDRILFDGAAAVDVAKALNDHNAEQEKQQQEAQKTAQNADPNHNQSSDHAANHTADKAAAENSTEKAADYHGSIDALIHDALSHEHQDVKVLIISSDLQNAQQLADSASAGTLVITYDPDKVSLDSLLDSIKTSLNGKKADSIAFAVESNSSNDLVISAADVTSSKTLAGDSAQKQFWSELGTLMDHDGRIDILSSKFAGTTEGDQVIDAIEHFTGAEVAASTDMTGSATGSDWILEEGNINVLDVYFNGEKIDSGADISIDIIQKSDVVVFVNSTVQDADSLTSQIAGNFSDAYYNVNIVRLTSDGAMNQMSEYFASHKGIDSVYLVSDGNDGDFYLGDKQVNFYNIATEYKDFFSSWKSSLADHADIMLYSCNTANTEAGQLLISELANYTGADVAASTNVTGGSGDWVLEYTIGNVEAAGIAVGSYTYNLAETKPIDLLIKTIDDKAVVDTTDTATTQPLWLREALYFATKYQVSQGYLIAFADSATLGGTTITMDTSLGEMTIGGNVTLNGLIALPNNVFTWATINAGGVSRHFMIAGDAEVTISTIELTNGLASGTGAANNGGSIYISSGANVTLNDVTIENSHADGSGGAIFNAGTLTITADLKPFHHWEAQRFYYFNNTATVAGGAVYNEGALTVDGNTYWINFDFNRASNGDGGAIYSRGTLYAYQANFLDNRAKGDGGAVYVTNQADTMFSSTTYYWNSAGGDGGALYFGNNSGDLELYGADFYYNSASGDGGAVYFGNNSGDLYLRTNYSYVDPQGRTITVRGNIPSTLSSNTADGSGGAIYLVNSGALVADFIRFQSNTAAYNGGAIFSGNSGNITLTDVNVIGNDAYSGSGGGLYYHAGANGGTLTISTSSISSNTAYSFGGGIYVDSIGSVVNIANTTLSLNTAGESGGGIYIENGSSLSLLYTTLAYNQASSGTGAGVALYYNGSTNSTITMIDNIVLNKTTNGNITTGSQILLGNKVTVAASQYNIFSHFDSLSEKNQNSLSDMKFADVTTVLADGSTLILGQRDGNGNWIGTQVDPAVIGYYDDGLNYSEKIQKYTYLSDSLTY